MATMKNGNMLENRSFFVAGFSCLFCKGEKLFISEFIISLVSSYSHLQHVLIPLLSFIDYFMVDHVKVGGCV